MKVMMNAKPMKTTEAMKAAVLEHLHTLDRYKNLIRAEVVMKTENRDHMAEVMLHGKKVHLFAKAKAENMYKAIKQAVKKLEIQLARKN